MKVAILGLGTVGFGVYDIIQNNEYFKNCLVKRILDKDFTKQSVVNNIITCDYQEILNDEEIEVVIETMGAGEFSYRCIKEAILKKKHVITANKEVIAQHLKELTKLKEANSVSLYYEASVGGGIPLIKPLYLVSLTNQVKQIKGILNGTTNFILSKMTNERLNFSQALKLAQEKGFAESDPTADLEGLDMVRKIAILSSICFKSEINIESIYHYGIKNISDIDIDFALNLGYVVKFMATSELIDKDFDIRIEPVFVSKDSIFSTVKNEFNLVNCEADINGELSFYGKGAGRYPTANAIVNDLIMIMNKDKNYSFLEKNKIEYKQSKEKHCYYLRLRDINLIDKNIIDKIDKNKIITKEINEKEIDELMKKDAIYFYARIGE